jgi:hypothetical protein
MKTEWIDVRRLLFDDDEYILTADDFRTTGPMKQAGKITIQPKGQFLCFNSFREHHTRRRDNIARLHTWVIEFDEMPLTDQRALWASSDMPHSLRVFSGNKSIHCYIRTVEDCTTDQWLNIADALGRIYPTADKKVLRDRGRFTRLPGGYRNGILQEVETIKSRIPLQTLLNWIALHDVTKDKGTKGQRDIGIKEYSKISSSLPFQPPGTLAAKIEAELEAQANAFQSVPDERRRDMQRLYDVLVYRRYKAAPGQRNDLLMQMITFLHDAVSRDVGLMFASEFWNFNQSVFEDPHDQHMTEAAAHWDTLAADYPNRLNDREREVYSVASAMDERSQTFFRICRSLAHSDDPPEGELSLSIPMHHIGHRMQIDGRQVSRLIDAFIRWGVLELIRKGTQHDFKDGRRINGESGVYRWCI